MKLTYFHFIKGDHSHPLEGFKNHFHSQKDLGGTTAPICLAGINGSGKSKLLELLSEIFFYLDNYFRDGSKKPKTSKLEFEIQYLLEKKEQKVKIKKESDNHAPSVFVMNDDEWKAVESEKSIRALLPIHIVGYTSGENETLSKKFVETYINYSEAVTGQTENLGEEGFIGKIPNTRLVFMDYKVNSFVFIANNLFRSQRELETIHKKIKTLDSLESFRITIQLKPRYKGRLIKINLTAELNNYIGALNKCSTCSFYDEENNKWILDFYVNEETKKLFKIHFDSAFNFYTSIYKLELLNDILLRKEKKELITNPEYPNQKHEMPELSSEDKVFFVENIRVNLKNKKEDIGYYGLSDGEHQLLHVLGTLMMIDLKDVLFLLDEPETHFNPQWRSKFIATVSEFKNSKYQEFLITTHSPFILSDCKKENVLIFKNGKAKTPEIQTYGLSMERMLQEAFGVIPPMSEKALKEIKALQKKTKSSEIEKRLDDFGESIEKFYLYERLEELKEKEKKEKNNK